MDKWTEERLQQLVADREEESDNLEFKSSKLFPGDDDTSETINKKIQDLTQKLTIEVVAFANTRGGRIVVGIEEEHVGKRAIANKLDDGINPARYSKDWILQKLRDSITPALPGIDVQDVPLVQSLGRVAYVITVPQGVTAYQAADLVYYQRSGRSCLGLRDNLIRALMYRSRLPRAEVSFTFEKARLAWRELQKEKLSQLRQNPSLVEFQQRAESGTLTDDELNNVRITMPVRDEFTGTLRLVNTGDVNLKDFRLHISLELPTEFNAKESHWYAPPGPDFKLFPAEECILDDKVEIRGHYSHRSDEEALRQWEECPSKLRWKLYLDDAPPQKGEIDLRNMAINLIKGLDT